MYDYDSEDRHRPQSRGQGHENGTNSGPGHMQQHGGSGSGFADDQQMEDDDMW
jgi:hypothetical protein